MNRQFRASIINKIFVMELSDIAKRVFGKDIDESSSKIVCKNSKKEFLVDVREWMQQSLTNISTSSAQSAVDNEDNRVGRIGTNDVYFTHDRSFGIVAINHEGLNVVAACRFASVTASCGVFEGKWMYELHLGSKGIMQIGWCTNLCTFTIDRGCGDTQNSYAYDGSRIKTWNMLSREYGELWKTGDVIGICVNLEERNIEFYRNGRCMGIAFHDIAVGAGIVYIPCVSLVEGESVYANFGSRPFRYPVAKYQPLQDKPYIKIQQTKDVLKWMQNLTNVVVPKEPEINNCNTPGDISDRLFWNRFYSLICYHLNALLVNRYCLFNNFLPFILDMSGTKSEKGKGNNMDKLQRILDEMWLYMKERNFEKALVQILNYSTHSFKQVSETLNSASKNYVLNLVHTLMLHKTTRKFLIKNLMFERMDIFAFMHHKPLDEQCFYDLIGQSWWDTKGQINEVEKHRKSFLNSFSKIEKFYDEMEVKQCAILKLILCNDDGDENEASSRYMFLKKLRKFCWHELECARNDLSSKIPSSIAYASFLRFVRVLYELWDEEVDEEKLTIPPQCFYDHTFKYSNCDRVGGLEQFLMHTFHDNLVSVLGEEHTIFSAESSRTPSLPMNELRTIGIGGVVNIVESNESVIESFIMPTTSNGPFYQTLFGPFFRQVPEEKIIGNVDPKNSLLELYEDLIIFFMSAVAKHCKKISKVQYNMEQCANDYNELYSNLKKMKSMKRKNESVLSVMENTIELQKEDLGKRAKKSAWVEHILLSPPRYQYFFYMFESLINIVTASEKEEDLFVFLPDFYLDACDTFVDVLFKDFNFVAQHRPSQFTHLGVRLAELMMTLYGDKRIKHIDCKKTPINILASFTTCKDGMKILEFAHIDKASDFIEKLMCPYTDRHWTASNWVLVRFWHGSGFGFRYSILPHHNPGVQTFTQSNYIMYNIACHPSEFYQKIIRDRLLDTNAQIPILLDSMISELHWIFGEFLTPMQELQRAIERNEQLLMMGRLYKMCSNYFDKTIGLLRVLDMYISVAPEVFLESYYPESTAFTRRIIQIVLLIIHRISSKQGCFRTVMNSRIAVLENVEFFPIESACIGILLDILHHEVVRYSEEDITIPLYCRMVLTDPSYDYDNLANLVGSPDTKNSVLVSLYDYEGEAMTRQELEDVRSMLKMLEVFAPKLSSAKVIPEDELCTICYSAPFDVKFDPCGHNSCLACISYYITRNRLCFFCKQPIQKVKKISNNEIIENLTDASLETNA